MSPQTLWTFSHPYLFLPEGRGRMWRSAKPGWRYESENGGLHFHRADAAVPQRRDLIHLPWRVGSRLHRRRRIFETWVVGERMEEEKTIKLIRKQPARGGFFDIQYGTSPRLLSSLEGGCHIEREFDDHHPLDWAFVVRCEGFISTFLFHTRSGVDQLLETHLSLFSDTAAGVSITKDCKRGD